MRFGDLKKRVLAIQSPSAGARSGLGNPAESVLGIFRKHPRVAVLCGEPAMDEDLPLLYSYIVEPAFRCGCTLLLSQGLSHRQLVRMTPPPEPFWGHPWSHERLLYLLAMGREPTAVEYTEPVPRWQRWWSRLFPRADSDQADGPLDPEQMAAVQAGDGVVQIIAPAGSGKTTVLVRRVRELQNRGTAAENILCMSFNREAAVEVGERLENAGLTGVAVRSFHAMGLAILREECRLRETIGELPDADLSDIIERVWDPVSCPRVPNLGAARNIISHFKLALMLTPREATSAAPPEDRAAHLRAALYTEYESVLKATNRFDFDDLVAHANRLLQEDVTVRARWQARFERVLVDEYQDIEPAQALLVGLLAAPQDSLFCVGDEDQCIYAWRRATVRRIIELDQVYPGLERHALVRNYRCGRQIVKASRRLIRHNKMRFRKPLHAGTAHEGKMVAMSCRGRQEGADLVAWLISDAAHSEVAVLARTTRLLAEVREACARTRIDPDRVEMVTIHAAKGRQWDRVIIYGADEGQVPHSSSLKNGAIEAERRLFYVAMTRAKVRLEVVCTAGRESRFLQEAGISVRAQA